MIDKENIMAGLECCADSRAKCLECPYFKYGKRCMETLIIDAKELAKEQERRLAKLISRERKSEN